MKKRYIASLLLAGSLMSAEPNPLVAAIHSGNLSEVARLLEEGTDPNERDHRGSSPLSHALCGHDPKSRRATKLLLEHDADPNAPLFSPSALFGSSPEYPLIWAINHLNEEDIQLLLKHGANPNAQTGSDSTALDFAIWNGTEEHVKLLLMYGANPFNFKKRLCGYTPNSHQEVRNLRIIQAEEIKRSVALIVCMKRAYPDLPKDMFGLITEKIKDICTAHPLKLKYQPAKPHPLAGNYPPTWGGSYS